MAHLPCNIRCIYIRKHYDNWILTPRACSNNDLCLHNWNIHCQNYFYSIFYSNNSFRSQFFTCHDSSAVMTCAKLWPDLIIIVHVIYLHKIWFMSSWIICEMSPLETNMTRSNLHGIIYKENASTDPIWHCCPNWMINVGISFKLNSSEMNLGDKINNSVFHEISMLSSAQHLWKYNKEYEINKSIISMLF